MDKYNNLECVFLKIRTDKFYFLKFILEAYDGLGILSSSQISKDIVRVRYPSENRRDIFNLLSSLATLLNPYNVSRTNETGQDICR